MIAFKALGKDGERVYYVLDENGQPLTLHTVHPECLRFGDVWAGEGGDYSVPLDNLDRVIGKPEGLRKRQDVPAALADAGTTDRRSRNPASAFLRISALRAAQFCPAAPATCYGLPEIRTASTARGQAYHAARAGMDPETASLALGADPVEVAALVEQSIPRPNGSAHELELVYSVDDPATGFPRYTVTGHLDAAAMYRSAPPADMPMDGWTPPATMCWGLVRDDKTTQNPDGEPPTKYDLRMLAYGISFMGARRLDACRVEKYYAAHGQAADSIDAAWITPGNVARIREWIDAIIVEAYRQRDLPPEARTYRPEASWHACLGCAGVHRCPGYKLMLDRAIGFVRRGFGFPLRDAKEVLELFEARSTFNNAARQSADIGKAIADFIATHGAIPVDDGRELRLNAKGTPALLKREP